jgi:hypothetical protein
MTAAAERFYGAWKLMESVAIDSDGTVTHPCGMHATGQLHYSRNGTMCVGGVRGEEDPPADTTKGEYPMFMYHGTFEVREADGVVMHYPWDSANPSDRRTPQKRNYTMSPDGKTLTLSGTVPTGAIRLTWQRT